MSKTIDPAPAPVPLPRLLVAAPASGSGKTVLTLALLRAFRDRGLQPAPFKCGPDYIDPLFHREAAASPGMPGMSNQGGNLDLFFTPPETMRGLLLRGSAGAGIAVLEGAMGLYDGVGGTAEASAWHVASETETPVVLVVRPRGAFLSLAAAISGFSGFRCPSHVAGIILSQCSPALCDALAPVLERETCLKVFGFLPDMPEANFPSRHLGLIAPDAPELQTGLDGKIAALAARASETVDMDALISLARSAPPLEPSFMNALLKLPRLPAGTMCRIAVARDAAFSFQYRENLDMLEMLGAELVFFSPLADAAVPEGAGGLYLGGGYPEVHARALSENAPMRASVARAITGGMPTLAEGGGFLYLHETVQDSDGCAHPLCGVIRGNGIRGDRLRRFGYMEMTLSGDCLLGRAGSKIKGHEFHYWDSDNCGESCLAEKPAGGKSWLCGHSTTSLFAGFPQVYFWSNPDAAVNFVRAAAEYRFAAVKT